ncbi:hypothetical protein GT037_001813 [Alternaria burnsii]|uniref:C3H1-type domain-containing protein n=1 Tax=Alternaria burnsii TaxID=1187904 RepID=A0A8H7ELI2_9PLEO|nr:uncharacterized protein GT037_001813 [Alternaria burnsii]KAF7680162.1 hypothetical protein GT037_001813 [Alternaria burnsii]CAI9628825.1 unnamed protein product [Alternaria burnsii]
MSPIDSSSQDTISSAIPAELSVPTPEITQEATSPQVSLSDENIALKRRIAALESAEERLTKRVTTAEQLAVDAKFETNAAVARAQKRYTEMLHANNETRHLRIVLAKEKKERADYLVGSKSVFQGLQAEICRLNEDKAAGAWAKELTEQIDTFEAGYLAVKKDKEALEKIISDLNKTITQLKGEKDVSDKMLNDFKKLITDLRQELDTEKSKSKAAPDALTKEQIEAHIATARDEANKEAATKAQGSIDTIKTSMKEQFETAIKNRQMQMQAQVQQYIKTQMKEWRMTEQRYKDDIAALESKLSAATKQIEWHGQLLAAAPNAIQHSHQRPIKHAQEVSPQEMFKPSKRRRLDSFGAAGITTPDFQHTRSASLLSDTNAISPGLAADTNDDAMMGGAHVRAQTQTPNNIHRRQLSQHSNGSAARMTPTKRLSQQQNGKSSPQQLLNMMSPQQEQQLFQQRASNDASRQSPTFGSYGPDPTNASPRLSQQMRYNQQSINQPGSLGLFKAQDFETHQSRRMRQQFQTQAQAQNSDSMQQHMQPRQTYGSASMMPPPQPRIMQVPSKRSMSFDGQPPCMNQEASRRHAPTIKDTQAITAFNGGASFLGETYSGDDWFSAGGESAMRTHIPRAYTPTLPSNATPNLQEINHQQPQQRNFQYYTVDPSQLQIGNERDLSYESNTTPNEPNNYMNDSRQPSVSGRTTRTSSRSTPAPAGRSRGRTPGPSEPTSVPCVNCYRHWWENECDEGEPCSNCAAEGVDCVRQKCFNFAAGTCDKGNRCPNIHEGDERYQDNNRLVDQTKAGKRPQRVGKKADAVPAPIMREQN